MKVGLDFFICAFGNFLAIETKAPGKKPTERQEPTIRNAAPGRRESVRHRQCRRDDRAQGVARYFGK
jgi:hypothetical protein